MTFDRETGEVDPMEAAEHRIGIDPIRPLLAKRARLVDKVANLRARYGSFGTYPDARRIELAKLCGLIRAQALRDGRKLTASQVEDEAHADPRYMEFVTQATTERAQWTILENQIQSIDELIMRGQGLIRFASAETFLTPRTG